MKILPLIATIVLGSIFLGCVSFQNSENIQRIGADVSAGGIRYTDDPYEPMQYEVNVTLQNYGDDTIWVNCPPYEQLYCRFEGRRQVGKPWERLQMPDFESMRLIEILPRSNLVCHVHCEVPLLKNYHRLFIPVWTNPILSPSFEILVYPGDPERTEIVLLSP